MSAGDELFAKAIFSSEEIKTEVDEYLKSVFSHMFRTVLIRKPVTVRLGQRLPFEEETTMLRNFITEYTQGLLVEAVKNEGLKAYMKDALHEVIKQQVERCVAENLKAFESAFKRNKTIPKGAYK